MSATVLLLGLTLAGDPLGEPPLPPQLPSIRVDPTVKPGAVPARPVIEPGAYPDFLSPEVWVAAALAAPRALALIAPRGATPVVTPLTRPETVFREGMNLTRGGQDHWWRHFAEERFPDRLRESFKRAVDADVARKYETGLKPVETFRFQGQKVEYRPYEFAPGRVNIGTAMPSSGYAPVYVRYGWPAALGATALIPSSAAPQSFAPSVPASAAGVGAKVVAAVRATVSTGTTEFPVGRRSKSGAEIAACPEVGSGNFSTASPNVRSVPAALADSRRGASHPIERAVDVPSASRSRDRDSGMDGGAGPTVTTAEPGTAAT